MPVVFLNQDEVNYYVTHQETIAIVLDFKHFRDIILGNPITVFTDRRSPTFSRVEILQVDSRDGT